MLAILKSIDDVRPNGRGDLLVTATWFLVGPEIDQVWTETVSATVLEADDEATAHSKMRDAAVAKAKGEALGRTVLDIDKAATRVL